jgi:flagellar hook assembly protein FlgD
VIDNTAVRFKIYNLAGELVRSFPPQPARIGGRVSALWDGRNDRGDYVGSGLYFVFAEVDYKRERPSRRLVVVR